MYNINDFIPVQQYDIINKNDNTNTPKIDPEKSNINSNNNNSSNNNIDIETRLFSLNRFIKKLQENSMKNSFDRNIYSNNITAYDIAINCPQQVLFKLLNTPVKYFGDLWLPVRLRSTIGSAVHEFIQSNYDFTECEVVVKIEDYHFSGRVDAIIDNNILVEIKTLPFKEYKSIVETNKPRLKDLKQTLVYKYFLENHLDKILETKEKTERSDKYNWPKQQFYKFKYIQFIYIAHDIISSNTTSINEEYILIKQLKKLLNSKNNKFYFIYVVNYNIDENPEQVKQLTNELINKLELINEFYSKGVTYIDEQYKDKSQCFFCPYKDLCNVNR